MNRDEFIIELRRRLDGMNLVEQEKVVTYYNESILDRIEDGMSEEEAVHSLGSLDEIVTEARGSESIPTIIQERAIQAKENMGNNTMWWVLVVLGLPIWLSLIGLFVGVAIAFFAVMIALVAVVVAFGIVAVSAIIKSGSLLLTGVIAEGLLTLAIGLVCGGLALLLINPVNQFSKLVRRGFSRFVSWVKRLIRG